MAHRDSPKPYPSYKHFGRFHSVGQGLFFTAEVHQNQRDDSASQSYRYVYDCGTASQQKFVEESIDDYTSQTDEPPELDLLMLSHLHADHISGLRSLLRNVELNMVILPYVFPAQRAVYLSETIESGDYPPEFIEWYRTFLVSPSSFFSNNGAEHIVCVWGGDNEPPYGSARTEGPEGPESEERTVFEGVTLQALAETDQNQIFFAEADCHADIKLKALVNERKAIIVSTEGLIIPPRLRCSEGRWQFEFFHRIPDESKLKGFSEEFRKLRRGRDLADVLVEENESFVHHLADLYHELFTKEAMNDTSLVVFSALHLDAENTNYQRVSVYCVQDEWDEEASWYEHIHPSYASAGAVFTGDLNLRKISTLTAFHDKFGLVGNGRQSLPAAHAFLLQVPHHGSKHNWPRGEDPLPSNPLYVIPAGTQHGHPDPTPILSLLRDGRRCVWVHEGRGLDQHTWICLGP